ncbi:MAG TPA: hypothetical protein VK845_15410, partial [Gemmatimonadales bacterium]|nr:hypothetical protein [Gemmatimonadales bacterium]
MSRFPLTIGLAAFAVALSACAKDTPVVRVQGDCAVAYQGEVCTWAMMQGTTVLEVGATIPMTSIQNAPDDEHMAWPPVAAVAPSMPEAAQSRAGLTHLTMFWEAGGHPPAPYMTPHFDFHFYTIPPADRADIDCTDQTKPAALPTGYDLRDEVLPPEMAAMIGVDTLVGICVPQMGMHSLLASELESTEVFRGSMVLGYYHGKPIFIEPMLTRALLMERQSFDLPIPEIPGMADPHPRAFRAEYDPEQDAY